MRRFTKLMVLLFSAGLLWTEPAGADATAPMTSAQALSWVRPRQLQVSPEGSKLAYVAQSYAWDVRGHLRIIDLETGAEKELTPAEKSETFPLWSPDGRRLAFLSNRSGARQIYVVRPDGSDPAALTDRKQGVGLFRWSPDGRSIAYLAADDTAPPKDGPQVADSDSDLEKLWLLNLETGETRRLGFDGWRIDDFQWRDSTHLLLQASDQPRTEEFTDALYTLDLAGGTPTRLSSPPQPFQSPTLSPDGKAFAFLSTATGGPSPRDLFVSPIGGGAAKDVSQSFDRSIVDLKWLSPRGIWLLVDDGFYGRVFNATADGSFRRIDLPLSAASFDVARNGDLFFVGEDFTHLAEIYMRSPDGHIKQLTHLGLEANGIEAAPASIFTTRSFDGLPIESALIEPPAPRGTPPPLVLLVHGGPNSNFTAGYGWETAWADLLAAHGYAVLMVNPRGSDGYDEAFMKANRGDWGGGDFRDLMAVLDAVVARGKADPNRLGIGGWSYGGEMSAWAITQTHRFKAAVSGAGVFDQEAEFETENDPPVDEWYFGTPWEHQDVFQRNSPSSYIRYATTPTLILDGEDDRNNPVGQSKGLYRALKNLGVETQLVIYPGEGHSPRKDTNNIDMFDRILGWYDAHLRVRSSVAVPGGTVRAIRSGRLPAYPPSPGRFSAAVPIGVSAGTMPPFARIQSWIFSSSTCSGSAPVLSTSAWNSRMSNFGPSAALASSRRRLIVSWPSL
jgi:dipeptidyl aminopeptidase/acylaminoacyl peptidase